MFYYFKLYAPSLMYLAEKSSKVFVKPIDHKYHDNNVKSELGD